VRGGDREGGDGAADQDQGGHGEGRGEAGQRGQAGHRAAGHEGCRDLTADQPMIMDAAPGGPSRPG